MTKYKVTAVLGPTNTGKTHLAIETMLSFESGMIGFPLRLLAREVYDKVIKKVGLDKRLNHFPSELSGGESQRVAISRALINSPDIILADEPTGNLDNKNARDIFNLLLGLRNKNRIIIFATHNRYFADMSDCKLSLIDGKIITVNARN